jgi:hypothetical protein
MTESNKHLEDAFNLINQKLYELRPEASKSPNYPQNDALRGSCFLFNVRYHIESQYLGK